MYILPENVYLFLPFIIFQGFLIVLVLFFFVEKVLSTRKIRLEKQLVKEEAYAQAGRILEDANRSAWEELNSAHVKAAEVIKQSEFLSKSVQDAAQKTFRVLVERQEVEFSRALDTFAKEMHGSFEKEKISSLAQYSDAISEIKATILGGVGVYKETMVKSLTNLDTEIKSRVTSALDETNAKIAEYEAASLKKIDLHIFDILRHVSLGVLGKSVSLQDHEEFILKSLGDAKVHERITL